MDRAPDRLEEANHLRDFEHVGNATREGSQAWRIFHASAIKHLNETHDVCGFSETFNRMKQLHLECHLREVFEAGRVRALASFTVQEIATNALNRANFARLAKQQEMDRG